MNSKRDGVARLDSQGFDDGRAEADVAARARELQAQTLETTSSALPQSL